MQLTLGFVQVWLDVVTIGIGFDRSISNSTPAQNPAHSLKVVAAKFTSHRKRKDPFEKLFVPPINEIRIPVQEKNFPGTSVPAKYSPKM